MPSTWTAVAKSKSHSKRYKALSTNTKKDWLTKVKLKSKDKSQIYFLYIQVAADQQSNLIDSKQIIYVGKDVNGRSEDHLMKHLKSG